MTLFDYWTPKTWSQHCFCHCRSLLRNWNYIWTLVFKNAIKQIWWQLNHMIRTPSGLISYRCDKFFDLPQICDKLCPFWHTFDECFAFCWQYLLAFCLFLNLGLICVLIFNLRVFVRATLALNFYWLWEE